MLLIAAFLLATPRAALAHLHLRRAEPAAGARLATIPGVIRLTFTEAPQIAVSGIQLTGPDGTVALAPAIIDPANPLVLVAPITGALVAGTYTVVWHATAPDGHPSRGQYTFTIAAGATGLASAPPPRAAGTAPSPRAGATGATGAAPTTGVAMERGFSVESPLYVIVRWVAYVALLALIGAVGFARLVVPRAARYTTGLATLATRAERGAASVGFTAAVVLALDTTARLIAQAVAINGSSSGVGASFIATIVTRTLWGWAWLLEAVAVLVALFALGESRRGRRGGWGLAALAVVALAVAFALSGHAVSAPRLAPLAVIADALHVLGAGGWLGTLLVVVVVGIPLALREPGGARGRLAADLVNGFSPVALACATLVALTGVTAAWIHLGTFHALWSTRYGRVLLIKLAVIAVVVALGAFNWRVRRPGLGDVSAARGIRRSAAMELGVGALVLAVTAVLVATPPPTEMAGDMAASSAAAGSAPGTAAGTAATTAPGRIAPAIPSP